MQDVPLSITTLFERAEQNFGHKGVVTATAGGREHVTYADWARRTRALGGVLDTLGISARRSRRHVRLEHRPPPRAVLRRAVHRPGPAHPEHPALPGPAHVHRQPRRRRGHLRRPLPARAAGAAAADVRARPPPRADGRRQGRGARRPARPHVARLRGAARRRRPRRVPHRRRVPRRQHVLHERHDGQPEGRRLHPPQHVPAHDERDDGGLRRRARVRPRAAGRADVPRQRVGPRPRRRRCRRRPDHAGAGPVRQGDRRPRRRGARHRGGGRADDLDAGASRAEGPRHVGAAGDPVRWLGRPEGALRGVPRDARAADPAGVGDDRDEPRRVGGPPRRRPAAPAPGPAGRAARRAGPRRARRRTARRRPRHVGAGAARRRVER